MAKGEKIGVSVVIVDVDDVLVEFSDAWSKATQKALEKIAGVKGLSEPELEKHLLKLAPFDGYQRNIPEIVADPVAPLKPADAVEEKAYAVILQDWRKSLQGAKVIEGVIATARKIKASGSLLVIYTDYPESFLLLRLANIGFPVELIDAIYAKPDPRKAAPPILVKGVMSRIKETLQKNSGKIVAIDFETPREDVSFILKDTGLGLKNASKALLVADCLTFDFSEIRDLGLQTAGVNKPADPAKAPDKLLVKFMEINQFYSFDAFKKQEPVKIDLTLIAGKGAAR